MSGRRPVADEPCTGAARGRAPSSRRTRRVGEHRESRAPRPEPEQEL